MREEQPAHPGANVQCVLRWMLIVFYGSAGGLHLLATDKFMLIVPSIVPFARQVVQFTGLCEIAGAIALSISRLRVVAGVMLALYAVCVFPANIKHAIDGINVPGLPSSWWYHIPRLLFQPVFVWAALFGADVTRWPFRKPSGGAKHK
jgi:uncharacterized membrane protein